MKSILLVLILLLLASPVMAELSVSFDPGQIGGGDPIGTMTGAVQSEIQNPTVSPCSSPVWKLVSLVVSSSGQEFDPDHCYQFIAVQEGDTAQCDLIQSDPPKTKCYAMIAGDRNDYKICNQMPASSDPVSYLKVDCFWEVAIKNNNPDACRAMGSQKISRMAVGEMSRTTCLARLKSGQGVGESTL